VELLLSRPIDVVSILLTLLLVESDDSCGLSVL
jgi:hypothetical protein